MRESRDGGAQSVGIGGFPEERECESQKTEQIYLKEAEGMDPIQGRNNYREGWK